MPLFLLLPLLLPGLALAAGDPPGVIRQADAVAELAALYAAPAPLDPADGGNRASRLKWIAQNSAAGPVLRLALGKDPSDEARLAAAKGLAAHPGLQTRQALSAAMWNRDEAAALTVTVRGEAARSFGRVSSVFRPGDRELVAAIEELKRLAREDRSLAPAAVDGIALCGVDKLEVSNALREIGESTLVRYSELARIRVVEWWRHHGIKTLGVTDSLEKMERAGNPEAVRAAANRAVRAGNPRDPEPVFPTGPPVGKVCIKVLTAR